MSDRSRRISSFTSSSSAVVAVVRRHARILARGGLCAVVAGGALATPASAQAVCKPVISVKSARFSEARAHRRVWTAEVLVDAGGCATKSGRFEIGFTRTIEFGPDLQFAEPFTWTPGEVSVNVEFAEHEWVLDYWVQSVAACPCQAGPAR